MEDLRFREIEHRYQESKDPALLMPLFNLAATEPTHSLRAYLHDILLQRANPDVRSALIRSGLGPHREFASLLQNTPPHGPEPYPSLPIPTSPIRGYDCEDLDRREQAAVEWMSIEDLVIPSTSVLLFSLAMWGGAAPRTFVRRDSSTTYVVSDMLINARRSGLHLLRQSSYNPLLQLRLPGSNMYMINWSAVDTGELGDLIRQEFTKSPREAEAISVRDMNRENEDAALQFLLRTLPVERFPLNITHFIHSELSSELPYCGPLAVSHGPSQELRISTANTEDQFVGVPRKVQAIFG